MQVNLKNLPKQPQTYVVDFPKLGAAGLNIRDLDYRLENDESPGLKNLWWKDGVLQCRPGQFWLSDDATLGEGFVCYERLFWGQAILHIGTKLYRCNPRPGAGETFALTALASGVPENRGTFFQYFGDLYYKNKGGFYKVSYDRDRETFACVDMVDEAYTPVIVINASPTNGSGTTYQPENRLSPKKTVWYNAVAGTAAYQLPVTDIDVMFPADPDDSDDYDKYLVVKVNGVTLDEGTSTTPEDYYVDPAAGTVMFTTAPDPGTPPANNTVEITYAKANTDAYNSIMDCIYGFVSGNGNNLCILLAGCPAQPNAVFWNSNDNIYMDPGYYPMSYYNLCGATGEHVTGFGQQYSDLILFKERSIGKLIFGVETVDDRESISFTYQNINDRTGCDMPRSIQLIENNLIFCNTSQGVHVLTSSSAAYENNIQCISDKVNGSYSQGLLADLREGGDAISFDDGVNYWLCANGHSYVWDYLYTTSSKPSWYFFDGVRGVSFFKDDVSILYHLDAEGRITRMGEGWTDYNEAIDKYFALPTQYFGGYDRLKDVLYVLITVRSDTDTLVQIRYDTDYETRKDLTPIWSWSWRFSPRNLSHRCLRPARYGHVAKRTPNCKHVRHFALVFGNDRVGEDLAIISAQIFYRFSGKER